MSVFNQAQASLVSHAGRLVEVIPNARQQFFEGEWLAQAGAGAERQASTFGRAVRGCRPHEDCLLWPLLPEALEHVFAAEAGKRQVQEHEIGVIAQRGREPFGAGGRLGDGESGRVECPGGEAADAWFIVDHQDPASG